MEYIWANKRVLRTPSTAINPPASLITAIYNFTILNYLIFPLTTYIYIIQPNNTKPKSTKMYHRLETLFACRCVFSISTV